MRKFKTDSQLERGARRKRRKAEGRKRARIEAQRPEHDDILSILMQGAFIGR